MLFIKENLIHLKTTTSTMDEIKGYPLNTILCADIQTNGRGKGNRNWDCKNNNLYFSISIDSSDKKLNYFNLSFLSAYAMVEAIKFFDKNNNLIQTKWPNDILINGKKCVGILLENDIEINRLIIGIGVNIDYFPNNTNSLFNPTSLNDNGIFVDKIDLLKKFIEIFDYYFDDWKNNGFKNIHDKWLKIAYNYKKNVIIKNNAKVGDLEGTFEDFDEEGTLILKDKNNNLIKIISGDIF